MKKRLAGMLLVAAAFALLAAAPATAAAPEKTTFTENFSDTITDICPSPIHLDGSVHVVELFWDTQNGGAKVIEHVVEHDAFSAHGTTITTFPYHYTVHVLLDSDGNLVSGYATGVVVRMRLPDGTLFNSAGRLNILPRLGTPFSIAPDTGHTGDIDAFCNALS